MKTYISIAAVAALACGTHPAVGGVISFASLTEARDLVTAKISEFTSKVNTLKAKVTGVLAADLDELIAGESKLEALVTDAAGAAVKTLDQSQKDIAEVVAAARKTRQVVKAASVEIKNETAAVLTDVADTVAKAAATAFHSGFAAVKGLTGQAPLVEAATAAETLLNEVADSLGALAVEGTELAADVKAKVDQLEEKAMVLKTSTVAEAQQLGQSLLAFAEDTIYEPLRAGAVKFTHAVVKGLQTAADTANLAVTAGYTAFQAGMAKASDTLKNGVEKLKTAAQELSALIKAKSTAPLATELKKALTKAKTEAKKVLQAAKKGAKDKDAAATAAKEMADAVFAQAEEVYDKLYEMYFTEATASASTEVQASIQKLKTQYQKMRGEYQKLWNGTAKDWDVVKKEAKELKAQVKKDLGKAADAATTTLVAELNAAVDEIVADAEANAASPIAINATLLSVVAVCVAVLYV